MEKTIHPFSELFAQLGLRDDPASIALFIAQHAPLVDGMLLHDAPFWSASQAVFLRESLLQDSDWADVVDRLGKALLSPPPA